MLKANNARVKVDFDGPAEYLAFVDTSITNLLNDLSPDVVEAGRKSTTRAICRYRPAAGGLECRLARAVFAGASRAASGDGRVVVRRHRARASVVVVSFHVTRNQVD